MKDTMIFVQQFFQILVTIGVAMFLYFWQRSVKKRDKAVQDSQDMKEALITAKLEQIEKAVAEGAQETKTAIQALQSQIHDYREHNEGSHKEIWGEHNNLRERVSKLEVRVEK